MKQRSDSIVTYKYLIVACLVSVMISTLASYFFYSRWDEMQSKYIVLITEKNRLQQDFNRVTNSFDKTFSDLMILRDENATVFTLHSTDSTKRYFAHVFWNHYTSETYIDVLTLPPPDSVSQYQLWAMNGSQPVNAGVFNVDSESGVQKVRPVANAESWAVTIEPKGGSEQPTLDRICLSSQN